MLALCDYVTPNEFEAEALTGLTVGTDEEARAAAARLIELGAGAAVITLGERGALFHAGDVSEVVPGDERWPGGGDDRRGRRLQRRLRDRRSRAATRRSTPSATAAPPRRSP